MPRTPQRRSAVGGTLIGVFIGIVVGLGLAATVAYWLMKNNPALPMPSLTRDAHEAVRDQAAKVAKADADKPRFDFYKILPGVEEPKVQPERRAADRGDRAVADQSKDRSPDKSGARAAPAPTETAAHVADKALPVDAAPKPAKPADRFWLQAGSFSTPPDAENLRARLALAGWEATVQEGALPDKSVRYRVRLGPYDNSDELGRMKSELAKRGFDVAVIRY
jgi:cell division protein FtsN